MWYQSAEFTRLCVEFWFQIALHLWVGWATNPSFECWKQKYCFLCTFLICLYRCITAVLHAVQEKVDDRDNIAATTERRWESRHCHVNVLKLYLDRDSAPLTPAKESNSVLFAVQHWNFSQGCLGVWVLSGANVFETQPMSAVWCWWWGWMTDKIQKPDSCWSHLS